MKQDLGKAMVEGRAAVGKTISDCPYGHDNQLMREAWCKAKLKAEESNQPLWKQFLFGSNPLSVAISWVVFFAAITLAFKILELIFGCTSEYGHSYC